MQHPKAVRDPWLVPDECEPDCPGCAHVAKPPAMSAHALGLMLHDAADYERRWLAECRAHGETQRQLDAALEILAAPYAHREDA